MPRPWPVSLGILPPFCALVGALHVVRTVPSVAVCASDLASLEYFPIEPEPDWIADHVDVRLDVDETLRDRATLARDLPSVEAGGLSYRDRDNPDGRFGSFELSPLGNLRIVFGTSTGFTGHMLEWRTSRDAYARVECGLLATDFVDFGPPFSFAWSDVIGFVHVSSLDWSAGRELVIQFDVRGTFDGRDQHDEGLLRLRLR